MARREGQPEAGEVAAAPSPWRELLGSEELDRRGLNMERLAEHLGVSASYLRLVRQGKRSPSRDKARLLLEVLGYDVDEQQVGSGHWDINAADSHGRVIRVEAKTRSPRPPIEKRLETLLDLADSLEQLERRLSRLADALEVEIMPPGTSSPGEAWPALSATAGGVALPGAGSLEVTKQSPRDSRSRRQVQKLLGAVPDEHLPLVSDYLTALLAREIRSSDDELRGEYQVGGCPMCGGDRYWVTNPGRWRCRKCKQEFAG